LTLHLCKLISYRMKQDGKEIRFKQKWLHCKLQCDRTAHAPPPCLDFTQCFFDAALAVWEAQLHLDPKSDAGWHIVRHLLQGSEMWAHYCCRKYIELYTLNGQVGMTMLTSLVPSMRCYMTRHIQKFTNIWWRGEPWLRARPGLGHRAAARSTIIGTFSIKKHCGLISRRDLSEGQPQTLVTNGNWLKTQKLYVAVCRRSMSNWHVISDPSYLFYLFQRQLRALMAAAHFVYKCDYPKYLFP